MSKKDLVEALNELLPRIEDEEWDYDDITRHALDNVRGAIGHVNDAQAQEAAREREPEPV
jgi:hypothetical protein